jgi:hypothetical protein
MTGRTKEIWRKTLAKIAVCWDYLLTDLLLGALAKSRKATISFVMSVCPSTWNKSPPLEGFFVKFDKRISLDIMSGKFIFD